MSFFTDLANDAELSLRARERCLTRLRAVLAQTPNNEIAEITLVLLFIVIRMRDKALFDGLVRGTASADEVDRFLRSLPGGQTFVSSRGGCYVFAFMLVCDADQERAEQLRRTLQKQAGLDGVDSESSVRANMILKMVVDLIVRNRGEAQWADVLAKVDIAAMIEGGPAQPAE